MAACHFDESLPRLLRIANESPGFGEEIETACVIRDLQGRLRLVLQAKEPPLSGAAFSLASLETGLRKELQKWFAGPILSTLPDARLEVRSLARELLQRAETWPAFWPSEYKDALGSSHSFDTTKWRSLQRVQSKETWLSQQAGEPPWTLEEGKPAIVSFYSFKGGVARTTTLGIVAYNLARPRALPSSNGRQNRILCIDLDLEAPGLSELFETRSEPGLIDFLLTFLATGQIRDPNEFVEQTLLHDRPISIIPAGKLSPSYLEKLARLDYLASGPASKKAPQSPVAQGLRILLESVHLKFDYILLDCRAGFHDLGGLGLHDLAHVDVLVGRANPQGLAALQTLLGVQKQRRKQNQRRLVMAQTFAPLSKEELEAEKQRYLSRLYPLFKDCIYPNDDQTPLDAPLSSHYPYPICQRENFRVAASLHEKDLLPFFEQTDFMALCERIEALCEPDGF